MNKLGLGLSVALCLSSAVALAADPEAIGSAMIGTWGGSPYYSGFWRSGADYSVLADGYTTFINSGNAAGAVLIRNNNNDVASFYGDQIYLRRSTQIQGYASVQNDLTVSGNVSAGNTLISYGRLTVVGGQPSTLSGSLDVAGIATLAGGIATPGAATFNGTATFNDTATFNPNAHFNQGITASPLPNGSAGYFHSALYTVGIASDSYALTTVGPSQFGGDVKIIRAAGTSGNLSLIDGKGSQPGGGMWGASSDRRVKKDVADFNLGLAEIERVNPVRFKYNGLGGTLEDGKEYVGVIAQELEQVAPFMVSTKQEKLHKEDKVPAAIKQVDASALTYMLVNAVQELASQNKELQRVVCQDHPTDRLCTPKSVALSAVSRKLVRAVQ